MGRKFGNNKFTQRAARMNLLPVIGNCKDSKVQLYNWITWKLLGFLGSKEIHKPKQYGHAKDIRDSNT